MSFTTRTTTLGHQKHLERLNDILIAGEATIEEQSNFVAQSTAQRAKHLIRSSVPAGDVHFREDPDRYVRASAPGQPPAIDLGYLISTISFKKYATGSAYAYASAYYAIDLEIGNTEIAPRPFMLPAFIAAVDAAERRFKSTFESKL